MAKITIPTPLRKFTSNTAKVDTNGSTVLEAIQDLANQYPGLQQHLFDGEGNLRGFIRIYVGDEDIKALNNGQTVISESAQISLIPAIAGGAGS